MWLGVFLLKLSKNLKKASLFLSVLLVVGCNHIAFQNPLETNARVYREEPRSQATSIKKTASSSVKVSSSNESSITKGIPNEIHPAVDRWIEYFTGRGRPHMQTYLERAEKVIPEILPVLSEEELPRELVYLAMIESGFSARAKSRASAVGFWQFMKGTAKDYGLRVDRYIDERRDLELSTQAASRYLKGLYNVFGSWHLAMASYNLGENRMKYLVMKYHTRDYWQLVKRKIIPKETRNYIPKFIAAMRISENPQKYGFSKLKFQTPTQKEEVVVHRPIQLSKLAKEMRVSYKKIKEINPLFKTDYVPASFKKSVRVRVPQGYKDVAFQSLSRVYSLARKEKRSRSGQEYVYYKVKSGDNLTQIARRFDSSIANIVSANKIERRSKIYKGMFLKIPKGTFHHRVLSKQASAKQKVHKVRRGDTLIGIAKKYGVSLSELRRLNQLRPRMKIFMGSLLKIPNY